MSKDTITLDKIVGLDWALAYFIGAQKLQISSLNSYIRPKISYSIVKFEKSQYKNSILQLNYRSYEKNIMIHNFLFQEDLKIWIVTFNNMYIFVFNK